MVSLLEARGRGRGGKRRGREGEREKGKVSEKAVREGRERHREGSEWLVSSVC